MSGSLKGLDTKEKGLVPLKLKAVVCYVFQPMNYKLTIFEIKSSHLGQSTGLRKLLCDLLLNSEICISYIQP